MTTTVNLTDHVERFVSIKQKVGYRFTENARLLRSFARFAAQRNETLVRSATVLEWASASASQPERAKRMHKVDALARWLHAEDARHEVPPRDAYGPVHTPRRPPCLISVRDIRKLLDAALSMPPAGTIAPLTWHYLFGLVAATGLRIGEARALTLHDLTPDGIVIRHAKFGKSRLVAQHPTTRDALNRYLAVRLKQETLDDHLFVLGTGRPPGTCRTNDAFLQIAERAGIRDPGSARGPTPHSLRHSFAVRSIENLASGADPGRHMLALATYMGHTNISATYWYLEATPVLLRDIAKDAERTHCMRRRGSHD